MIYLVLLLAIFAALLVFQLLKKSKETDSATKELVSFKEQYKDVDNVNIEVKKRNEELHQIDSNINGLKTEYAQKRDLFTELEKELSVLEENLENISYGLYKPHFDFTTSEEYKQKLEEIWERQKDVIKNEAATYCPTEWSVGGSKAEGKKMTKQASKLMLRAFNGESDSAIARVSWNNMPNMEARIQKAFEAINKLGSSNNITITDEYYKLKMAELYLAYELQQKLQEEKEEQRRIKEQIREEEKALAEIEKAKKQAADEEEKYQKALLRAKEEIQNATGKQVDELNKKIAELEGNLQQAQEQKQRALSRAQMTKSGHVYIISNIGSFGENIYKIGMTRRLEPMDRIKELSDASVPFDFDVHAIIYTDNAPELENRLHNKYDHARVNLVNQRREFFNVSIEDIEVVAKELGLPIQLTKMAEAKEFRTSLSIRETRKATDQKEVQVAKKSKFPEMQ
jgi:chromosome segregation ATPase